MLGGSRGDRRFAISQGRWPPGPPPRPAPGSPCFAAVSENRPSAVHRYGVLRQRSCASRGRSSSIASAKPGRASASRPALRSSGRAPSARARGRRACRPGHAGPPAAGRCRPPRLSRLRGRRSGRAPRCAPARGRATCRLVSGSSAASRRPAPSASDIGRRAPPRSPARRALRAFEGGGDKAGSAAAGSREPLRAAPPAGRAAAPGGARSPRARMIRAVSKAVRLVWPASCWSMRTASAATARASAACRPGRVSSPRAPAPCLQRQARQRPRALGRVARPWLGLLWPGLAPAAFPRGRTGWPRRSIRNPARRSRPLAGPPPYAFSPHLGRSARRPTVPAPRRRRPEPTGAARVVGSPRAITSRLLSFSTLGALPPRRTPGKSPAWRCAAARPGRLPRRRVPGG